jgi:hypothetical protein
MIKPDSNSWGFPRVDNPALPGVKPDDIGRVIYVILRGHSDSYAAFDEVIAKVRPPIATHGAALVQDWLVRSPAGETFYPLSFHGDVEGWRQQIELGASQLGLKMATVKGRKFVVSDGRAFLLSDCAITRGGSPYSLSGHEPRNIPRKV